MPCQLLNANDICTFERCDGSWWLASRIHKLAKLQFMELEIFVSCDAITDCQNMYPDTYDVMNLKIEGENARFSIYERISDLPPTSSLAEGGIGIVSVAG